MEAANLTDRSSGNTTVYAVDVIRCTACLMIFFYHCNTILPGEFRWLTFFGEDMGNQLFFMISGFSLFSSVRKTEMSGLPRWYYKRLIRILPMLFLFYLLSFLTGFYSFRDPAQVFAVFVYPTLYWFVTAILVFYPLLFLFLKIHNRYIRGLILFGLLALWCVRTGKMEAYYFAGALSMFTGALLKEALDSGDGGEEERKWLVPVSLLSFLSYVFVKYLKFSGIAASVSESFFGAVSVAAGILVIITGSLSLTAGYSKNKELSAFFEGKELLYGIVRYIGLLAFPLYMIQCFNAGIIGFTIGNKINFPLSFAVNLIVVWGLAIMTDRVLFPPPGR